MNHLLNSLTAANTVYQKVYPGENFGRQPVHTVYGGAHIFNSNTAHRIRDVALRSFEEYVPDAATLQDIFAWQSREVAEKVYLRVRNKLKGEAVEDFRIDFEDGFGHRSDTEEDQEAIRTANEVAIGMRENTLPPYIGIRIKTLSEELKARSFKTLDLFISTLVYKAGGKLPSGFAVTLPKIVHVDQVQACTEALDLIEAKTSLKKGSVAMEFMVETPQSIFGYAGEVVLPSFVAAAKGRARSAHFGTYDYTASLNITADHQSMDHPACDFARSVMKVALAGTGVWLSDGATNVMPVPVHKEPKNQKEQKENRDAIYKAWRLNYGHVQHSLRNALYQGWDLHPAQLPVRYAALYAFFLKDFDATSARLRNFIDQAAKATLVGNVFDDAATGQGLLNYFLRALGCGAITEEEVLETGLTLEEIRTRSFKKILEGRAGKK